MSLSSGVGASTALSIRSLYSSSSQSLCRVDSGSFNVTGIEILLKSFPMFLHSRFHRFTPSVSVLGTGSCRLQFSILQNFCFSHKFLGIPNIANLRPVRVWRLSRSKSKTGDCGAEPTWCQNVKSFLKVSWVLHIVQDVLVDVGLRGGRLQNINSKEDLKFWLYVALVDNDLGGDCFQEHGVVLLSLSLVAGVVTGK